MTVEPFHSDYDLRVDIEPFDNTVWKSPDARDRYADPLGRATAGKQVAEWRSVLDGQANRRAAIIHVTNQNRDKWIRRAGEHGLAYRGIRHTSPYGGFAHSFSPTDPTDPERITYAVIAESEDIADKMEEAELEMSTDERHFTIGTLLGFPECCREHFYEWFVEKQVKDPLYESACNTPCAATIDGDRNHVHIPEPNPGINPLMRYFGHSFVTHIPCSFTCEGSVEIARDRYRIMSEHGYGDAAEMLAEWLAYPAEWTSYKRISEVRNPHFSGAALGSAHVEKKVIRYIEEHESQGMTPGEDIGHGSSGVQPL